METSVSITELAPATITRSRGHEAYRKLQDYLAGEAVEIDLSGAELLSMSFLDEIVSKLLESRQLDRVTFLAADPSAQQKLARIAGIRNTSIFFRTKKEEPRQLVQPRQTDSAVTFALSKQPLEEQASPVRDE